MDEVRARASRPAASMSDCAGNSLESRAALDYAANGVAVHPVDGRSKHPLTAHGRKDATTDPTVVDEWWWRWPTGAAKTDHRPAGAAHRQ